MTENQQIFVQLFIKNACNVAVACKKMGINRSTYYDWYNGLLKSSPKENEFKQAIDEARESIIDFAESALFKKISGVPSKITKIKEIWDSKNQEIVKLREETTSTIAPDTACVIFLLKSLGRKRGWTDRQDLTIESNLGNEQIGLDLKESINKLTPEEKKELIRISKKIQDD